LESDDVRTTVELRNENSVFGTIDKVDANMNMWLSEVNYYFYEGQMLQFPQLFINGRHIRYVHIPDEIDIVKALAKKTKKMEKGRLRYTRKIKSTGGKQNKKQKAIASLTTLGYICWITYTAYGLSAFPIGIIKGRKHLAEETVDIQSKVNQVRDEQNSIKSKYLGTGKK